MPVKRTTSCLTIPSLVITTTSNQHSEDEEVLSRSFSCDNSVTSFQHLNYWMNQCHTVTTQCFGFPEITIIKDYSAGLTEILVLGGNKWEGGEEKATLKLT